MDRAGIQLKYSGTPPVLQTQPLHSSLSSPCFVLPIPLGITRREPPTCGPGSWGREERVVPRACPSVGNSYRLNVKDGAGQTCAWVESQLKECSCSPSPEVGLSSQNRTEQVGAGRGLQEDGSHPSCMTDVEAETQAVKSLPTPHSWG